MNTIPHSHTNKPSAKVWTATAVIISAIFLQACALNVPIEKPAASTTTYEQTNANDTKPLLLLNNLGDDHEVSYSRLPIKLKHEGSSLDVNSFVFDAIKAELAGRGLPVDIAETDEHVLSLNKFAILSHRVSGFSPMVTISTFQADLQTPGGTQRFGAMIKRGKVPVWSMSEVNEPCYNEPIELLVKELAAKVNRSMFDYQLSNEQVDALVSKVNAEANESRFAYFDVYELGFSNNPNAIPPLLQLTQHTSEYVRMAAISSLGILGAVEHFAELQSIYQNAKIWQDRGMALKAIGDLNTDEGNLFLAQEREKWKGQDSNESSWNTIIIDLYLD